MNDKAQFSHQPDPDMTPEQFFSQVRNATESEQPKGRQLTVEEDRKMQDGFAVAEMMKSAGWSVVQDILQIMPKANIDPRGMTRQDWIFAQENAFWQGAVAKEIMDGLYQLVNDAHQLHRLKIGEVQESQRMRF